MFFPLLVVFRFKTELSSKSSCAVQSSETPASWCFTMRCRCLMWEILCGERANTDWIGLQKSILKIPEMSTMIWRYLKPKLRCGGQIMRRWNGQTASFRYNVCHLLRSMCGNPGNQHVKTRACRKRWWTLETVLDAKLSHFLKSNYAKLFIPK